MKVELAFIVFVNVSSYPWPVGPSVIMIKQKVVIESSWIKRNREQLYCVVHNWSHQSLVLELS